MLRIAFTQNEKKIAADDNENQSIVCYRSFIVLFLTLKKEGQWPTIWVNGH